MKVVVTGATGNVGTGVVEALGEEPGVEQILGLARRLPAWKPPKATFAEADFRSADLDGHVRGAGAVVHLAWAFQPTHAPVTTWEVNVLGSIRVFEAAARAGVSTLVYASSVGAYSPGPGKHVDETWPTHSLPTAAYGREKAYVERYLDAFELRHPDIRVVRLRPSFIFKRASGLEQHRIFAGPFVPRALFRSQRLPVVPMPSGLRFQAVHTDDAAQAYRLALMNNEARGAYNVAADPVVDAAMIADLFHARRVTIPAVVARASLGVAWRLRLARADEALLNLVLNLPTLDVTRIKRELGWRPRWTGLEALEEMFGGMVAGAGAPTPPLQPAG
ncbi:NAD-dependent epimerase/dehydratase family protein [Phytoactinopolyspora mesophila]|uniref:NAD-dependent epimerase/dehydratase family protein n=1 Tax=Phytoactinopolyspora mesophila TaxID=2650750 RepID=A0A7K3M667_9ACTN|nr:NAD-dependent epimerase/dehydratase family protein [Phytoactinopolyspora mesophila]NDL58392.1 NAD-dependent epimerase/dehydratase family protein [Phytoactinopolyspora mesophila]